MAAAIVAALATTPVHAGPGGDRLVAVGEGVSVPVLEGWTQAPRSSTNATVLVAVPAGRLDQVKLPQAGPDGMIRTWTPRVTITIEHRPSHADAVARLGEIAREVSTPPTFLAIGGWPALQRSHLGPLPRRGRTSEDHPTAGMAVFTTTAIADGADVVRLEGVLPPDAGEHVFAAVQTMGRDVQVGRGGDPARTERELAELRALPPRDALRPPLSPSGLGMEPVGVWEQAAPGAAMQLFAGQTGELEIAASADGRDVVVARQRAVIVSNDGGQTFNSPIGLPFSNRGDPSMAVAESGAFYWAAIHNTADCTGDPLFGCATGIMRSTDRGLSFPFVADAVDCDGPAGASPCFPDQEHIAADRWNAAPGGDQVYSVWRNFTAGELPTIVCSQDSGATWSAPLTVENPGIVPRVNVGPDGSVYVVYQQGYPGGNIRVAKFSSCASGLSMQAGFPVTAAAISGVSCPVPGLDRCNDGNLLTSYMVAVDESNASRVFLVYADANGGGGESIYLRRSTDGGATWGAAVAVNGGAANVHRFMPWLSVADGVVHVTWYDRRAVAAGGTNDQTDYFRNTVDAGTLAVGAEAALQVNQDPQCASGWPCGTRSTADSEQCTTQPQLAGYCDNPSGTGSGIRCDFSDGGCPAGETCLTSGGCPKYGDYNGNALGGGWAFSAWASATAPPGAANSGSIDIYFEAAQVGADPDVSITKLDVVDPVSTGDSMGYTITVSNNGDTLATGITVTDQLNAPFQSVSAAGWSCTTPLVGGTGQLSCSLASLAGGASSQIAVALTAPNIIGTVSNTAVLTGDNDGTAANNTAGPITTTVNSPADVSATKTAQSSFQDIFWPGGAFTYTVVLTNASTHDQFDNPGAEFTDVVPAQVTVTGVSASAGTASHIGNTVTWNGVVPGSGSVSIFIECVVNDGTDGLVVSNQGTVSYDSDGNGSNDASRLTDDPAVGGLDDPTEFQIRVQIPTLSSSGVAAFLLVLALAGAVLLLRRGH